MRRSIISAVVLALCVSAWVGCSDPSSSSDVKHASKSDTTAKVDRASSDKPADKGESLYQH